MIIKDKISGKRGSLSLQHHQPTHCFDESGQAQRQKRPYT